MSTTGVVGTSSVVASLLTQDILTRLQNNGEEDEMLSISLLVTKVILGAIDALKKGELKKLDGNPGNASCQNQAIILRKAILLDLSQEYGALCEAAQNTRQLVLNRKNSAKKKGAASDFFKQHVETLTC